MWTTDKDGLIPDLLAAEITAKTGKNPAQLHQEQVDRFGESWYKRVDTPTTLEQKQKFAKLSGDDVAATQLAGEDITAKLTEAPGNHAKIGGLKVTTENNWFAARPSRHREHLQGVRRVLRIPRSPRQGARPEPPKCGQGLGRVIIGESA